MSALKVSMVVFGYGGLNSRCHDSIFMELTHKPNADIEWTHRTIDDDALIDRSRSRAASRFLQSVPDEERRSVFVFVDHDIQWRPGDLGTLARQAAREQGIVGGLYACRSMQRGFSSRLAAEGASFKVGGDKLHPAEYVATGFMACSVVALRRISACCQRPDATPVMRITECIGLDTKDDSFFDFFRPVPLACNLPGYEGKMEYASEDWAFAARARYSEVPLFVSETPILKHWGPYPFTINAGARPKAG